jgi:preprotein translocase subunit SecY
MLVIFRIAAHIPLPGVNIANLKDLFSNNRLLDFIGLLSGGGMKNFSIVSLGIAPYITASIIMQLLTMVVPKLEELSKEGERGYHKINDYTRKLTPILCIIQSIGLISYLKSSQYQIIGQLSVLQFITAIISMTAGTMFLVWIGELITEKKIGNGISVLIFAGILAGVPSSLRNTFMVIDTFNKATIFNLIIFGAIFLITLISIIYITEAQRNIPISYGKIIRGTRIAGGMRTHLPLKLNQAGVIPIIFAISIILFPTVLAQFFVGAKSEIISQCAEFVIYLFKNQVFYGVLYFFLVIAFTYFYTSVVFKPERVAENLQRQGGFIPGVRPGRPTAEYLKHVSHRIMLPGSIFLATVAVLPLIVQNLTQIGTLLIGGTSMLIVVSVCLEIVRQIDSQLTMRDYDEL